MKMAFVLLLVSLPFFSGSCWGWSLAHRFEERRLVRRLRLLVVAWLGVFSCCLGLYALVRFSAHFLGRLLTWSEVGTDLLLLSATLLAAPAWLIERQARRAWRRASSRERATPQGFAICGVLARSR